MDISNTAIVRPAVARELGSRLGSLAGFGFAAALFAAVAMLETPRGATDGELTAWWSDHGNRTTAIVSMELFVVAGLCFLVFLAALRSRLAAAEGGTGQTTWLVGSAGVVFVAMVFVAATTRGVIGFSLASPTNHESLPGPDTLRFLPQIGYALAGTGMLAAAGLVMASTSCLVFTADAFGRWLGWTGFAGTAVVVAASVLLSAVFAIPAFLLWTVAASVALWRQKGVGA